MAARILSTLAFWILMIPIIIGSTFIVVAFYLPFVALKAAWLALTGRLHEAIGERGDQAEQDLPRPHIG